jgi:hypothetical protein
VSERSVELAVQRLGDDHALVLWGPPEGRISLLRSETFNGHTVVRFHFELQERPLSALLISEGLNRRLRRDLPERWLVTRAVAADDGFEAYRHRARPLPSPGAGRWIRPGRRLSTSLDAAEATPMGDQLRACGLTQVGATLDGAIEVHAAHSVLRGQYYLHEVAAGTARELGEGDLLEEWVEQEPVPVFPPGGGWAGRTPRWGEMFAGGLDALVAIHRSGPCGGSRHPGLHVHTADDRVVAPGSSNRATYYYYDNSVSLPYSDSGF